MSDLLNYSLVEAQEESKVHVVGVGLDEYPELKEGLEAINSVEGGEFLDVGDIDGEDDAELLIPMVDSFLYSNDCPIDNEELDEMGGCVVTDVIQMHGERDDIIVLVTFNVDGEEGEDSDEADWD